MAITPTTDIVSLSIGIGVMMLFDAFAFRTKIGLFYIMAVVIGLYMDGSIFNSGSVTLQTVCTSAGTCFNQTIDPNLMAIIVACLTIFSAYFVYWEKQQ